MLHAHLPAFKEMRDAVFDGKFPHRFALLGGIDVFIGCKMIQNQSHFIFVENLFPACRTEFPDGDGRGDIIAQSNIHASVNQLTGRNFRKFRVRH